MSSTGFPFRSLAGVNLRGAYQDAAGRRVERLRVAAAQDAAGLDPPVGADGQLGLDAAFFLSLERGRGIILVAEQGPGVGAARPGRGRRGAGAAAGGASEPVTALTTARIRDALVMRPSLARSERTKTLSYSTPFMA